MFFDCLFLLYNQTQKHMKEFLEDIIDDVMQGMYDAVSTDPNVYYTISFDGKIAFELDGQMITLDYDNSLECLGRPRVVFCNETGELLTYLPLDVYCYNYNALFDDFLKWYNCHMAA